jgi:hypothetical protein
MEKEDSPKSNHTELFFLGGKMECATSHTPVYYSDFTLEIYEAILLKNRQVPKVRSNGRHCVKIVLILSYSLFHNVYIKVRS